MNQRLLGINNVFEGIEIHRDIYFIVPAFWPDKEVPVLLEIIPLSSSFFILLNIGPLLEISLKMT